MPLSPARIETDALVVGAGFYGCSLALALRRMGFGRVLLVDQADRIMTRASAVNQARLHNGYHYPRALATALACRRHFARFQSDYGFALARSFDSYYLIARNSRVSPGQFERFCDEIKAPLSPAPAAVTRLFDPQLIAAAYRTDELAFDAALIAAKLERELAAAGVATQLGARARFAGDDGGRVHFRLGETAGVCRLAINASYAALDEFGVSLCTRLKKELVEMAVVSAPAELADKGLTVMDGPFFSLMPLPARAAHVLTHVRYTPICAWSALGEAERRTLHLGRHDGINSPAMIRDAARYVPSIAKAELRYALIDVKTVIAANEDDDGRPVLFEQAPESPRVLSVLGSKIDAIYDAIEALQQEFAAVALGAG